MIESPADALAFVRRHKVVGMTAGAFPSLVEAIAGGPVRGSWWGHERGKQIYALATAIEDSGEVVPLKLEGKVALVHRALWPALLRVVTDAAWRRGRARELDAPARMLLARVQRTGEVHVAAADKKARVAIEAHHLAIAESVHTEAGHHETILRSWKSFARRTKSRVAAGDLADAVGELAAAGIKV